MDRKDNTRLLFGPYEPPRTRRGNLLICARYGKVRVGGWSDGPIPWPVKWGTRKSIIVCGDLIRALHLESAAAVAWHWGVCKATVWNWRSALGIDTLTPGTLRLYRRSASEDQPTAIFVLFASLRSSPQQVRWVVEQLLTHRSYPQFQEALRAICTKPSAEGPKRFLFHVIRKHGWPKLSIRHFAVKPTLGMISLGDREVAKALGLPKGTVLPRAAYFKNPRHRYPAWKPKDERTLGAAADEVVARKLGRTVAAVRLRRLQKGIPIKDSKIRPWTSPEDRLLGTRPDRVVARMLGRTLLAVRTRRQDLRRLVQPRPQWRPWTPEEDRLLGTRTDHEIAALLRRSYGSVYKRRRHLRISRRPVFRPWSPKEEQLLGTMPDAKLAALFGRSVDCIRVRRVEKKAEYLNPACRHWDPREDRLLGTAADKIVARKLRRSVTAVARRRKELRILLRPVKPWAPHEDQLLGKMSDLQLADQLGRSIKSIRHRRLRLALMTAASAGRGRSSRRD